MVGLDTLYPSTRLTVAFWCEKPDPWPGKSAHQGDSDLVPYHILGSCQFEIGGELALRKFISEIKYEEADRHLTCGPLMVDDGTMRAAIRTEMI